jgi:hypothetical protein
VPQAKIGQRVQVDVSDLQPPGGPFGGGASIVGGGVSIRGSESAFGTITGIEVRGGLITVALDVPFRGQKVVTMPASHVTLIQ